MTLPPVPFPKSAAEIEALQRAGTRRAVEQAKRAPFFAGKLDHVRLDRLDDPEEWRKIPILDKEMLRALPPDRFYTEFCLPRSEPIAEFWRSGGTTGKPLFYPRTARDLHYAMEGFKRTYQCVGCKSGETAHMSLPLGIHPAGHMWARAGERAGIAMVWAGSGSSTPSTLQLDLIQMLKPSLLLGMSSYALHLANLAEASGIDLAAGSVKTVMCTAEPLSAAKRDKIASAWGATVFDSFGMTEVMMMGAEASPGAGFSIWSDFAFLEILDPDSLKPVEEGRDGTLVVTPLVTNNATPFLRWNTGDVVRAVKSAADGPFAHFPVIQHARRTAGFFKFRGININHAEFEDLLFAERLVNDFKAELITVAGVDQLRLSLEVKRGAGNGAPETIARRIKGVFEVSPEVIVLPLGTLAKEFESSVKAPRFVDART